MHLGAVGESWVDVLGLGWVGGLVGGVEEWWWGGSTRGHMSQLSSQNQQGVLTP